MHGTGKCGAARELCVRRLYGEAAVCRAAASTLSSLLVRCRGEQELSDRPIPPLSLPVSESLLGASIREILILIRFKPGTDEVSENNHPFRFKNIYRESVIATMLRMLLLHC